MLAYAVRRIASGFLMILLLTFLTFAIYKLIPVDPACLRIDCGPGNHSTPADFANADHQLGVDRPLPYQYARWVWRIVRHGSFGTAWIGGTSIDHAIGQSLPITAWIVAGGLFFLLLLALPLGAYAALRPRSPTDRGLLAVGILGLAIHPFVLAIAIKELFGLVNVGGDGYCSLIGSNPQCQGVGQWANHMILPWFCFALFFLPLYLRMVRVRMLETLNEQWVVTARAKGASEHRVVFGHVMRNAVAPLLPMVAADAGTALTAAIYIELVFHLNGMGQLAVQALSGSGGGYDRAIIVAIVATVGVAVVVLNVIADIGRAAMDPRVRLRTETGLFPMPRFLKSSPLARIPKPVYAVVAVVGLIALGIRVYTYPNPPSGIVLVKPLHVQPLNITTKIPLNPGSSGAFRFNENIVVTLKKAVFGKSGWRIDYSIKNETQKAIAPTPLLRGRTGTGYSLGFNVKGGEFLAHRTVEASQFLPRQPGTLYPGQTYSGSFGGIEGVPHGAQYEVTMAEFASVNPPGAPTYISITAKRAP